MNLSNGMLRVNEYYVVREKNAVELTNTVNEMLKQGWQPLGAPNFIGGSNWMQAVVKYQSDEV